MGKNVAVFVDVANIFYAAKAAGVDIDYVLLLKAATAGRDLVRAYAYTGLDPDNENQRNFHSFLARHDFRVVSKDIRKYGDGKVKANLDIELVVDMMKTARNLDVAVVVSGDGDFAPAIRAVQEMGVRVEVISFRGNTSSDLMDVADKFTDITQLAKVERASTVSGRRVASDDEDLSMTEVPDKLSEGTGPGVAAAGGASAWNASPWRLPARRRACRSRAAHAARGGDRRRRAWCRRGAVDEQVADHRAARREAVEGAGPSVLPPRPRCRPGRPRRTTKRRSFQQVRKARPARSRPRATTTHPGAVGDAVAAAAAAAVVTRVAWRRRLTAQPSRFRVAAIAVDDAEPEFEVDDESIPAPRPTPVRPRSARSGTRRSALPPPSPVDPRQRTRSSTTSRRSPSTCSRSAGTAAGRVPAAVSRSRGTAVVAVEPARTPRRSIASGTVGEAPRAAPAGRSALASLPAGAG